MADDGWRAKPTVGAEVPTDQPAKPELPWPLCDTRQGSRKFLVSAHIKQHGAVARFNVEAWWRVQRRGCLAGSELLQGWHTMLRQVCPGQQLVPGCDYQRGMLALRQSRSPLRGFRKQSEDPSCRYQGTEGGPADAAHAGYQVYTGHRPVNSSRQALVCRCHGPVQPAYRRQASCGTCHWTGERWSFKTENFLHDFRSGSGSWPGADCSRVRSECRRGRPEILSISRPGSLNARSKVSLAPVQAFVCQNLTPGLEKKVLVSSAGSPSKFHCQLYCNADKLQKLSRSINCIYSKLRASEELLDAPSPGYPCCAQFTVDGCWYRALITQVSGGRALVLYIDFGNSETLPFAKIKRLLPEFLKLPRQALVCSLNRVRANGKTWSQAALKRFIALTEGAAKMKVVAQGDRGIHHVELVIRQPQQEKNISDELLLAGSAVLTEWSTITNYPSLTLDVGQYEDVEVTCIEDPYRFWCTLSKFTNQH